MRVRVKLLGTLKEKTPPGGHLDLPERATIDDALSRLDIAAAQVQMVMVNGRMQANRQAPLSDDDELTVIAPVGGG